MKMILGAIALLIAAPVAAQAAPASDPHAGHAQHQQHDGQQKSGHAEHKGDCCKDGKHKECCDKAKQQAQKADCCAEHAAGHGEHKAHGASH